MCRRFFLRKRQQRKSYELLLYTLLVRKGKYIYDNSVSYRELHVVRYMHKMDLLSREHLC